MIYSFRLEHTRTDEQHASIYFFFVPVKSMCLTICLKQASRVVFSYERLPLDSYTDMIQKKDGCWDNNDKNLLRSIPSIDDEYKTDRHEPIIEDSWVIVFSMMEKRKRRRVSPSPSRVFECSVFARVWETIFVYVCTFLSHTSCVSYIRWKQFTSRHARYACMSCPCVRCGCTLQFILMVVNINETKARDSIIATNSTIGFPFGNDRQINMK
jgi:hypothetical protein